MKKATVLFCFFCLFVTSVYCTGLLLQSAALGVSFPVQAKGMVQSAPKAAKPAQSSTSTASSSAAPKPQSSAPASSAQTAAAPETALGKVFTKTIPASSATVAYNRVYLKNSTTKKVDIKALLSAENAVKIEKNKGPSVLIVHTHTSESYLLQERDYYTKNDAARTTDDAKNVVAVGEVLKQTLEKGGVGVVHATEKHDYPEYTGSYNRAAATIKKYLKQYPSIKIVIDLHRDSVSDAQNNKTALVKEVAGKKAAQVMLVCGCQDGEVSGFEGWQKNLQLAVKLQQTTEVLYPGLTRPILLTARRYNLNLTPGSLLLEFGTEANTLTQAKYSAELVGKALVSVINTLK